MDNTIDPNTLIGPAVIPSNIHIYGSISNDFKNLDFDGYTILWTLGEKCDGLSFFPTTGKILIEGNNQTLALNPFVDMDKLTPSIAENLNIDHQAAFEKSGDFFADKSIVVQPTGIQGKTYQMMQYIQHYIPMKYTAEAVSILKTTGTTGLTIVTRAPLTFVGATYIGSLFFGYCGSIAGPNVIGSAFDFTSFVLSRPMRTVEVVVNGLVLRPISNFIGLPLILNGTQEVLRGKGIPIQEWTKIGSSFQRVANSRFFQKVQKVYRVLMDNKDL